MICASRKKNNKLLKIHIGKKKMSCTHNHKILTNNGYIEARNLNIGDLILSNYDIQKQETCVSYGLNSDQEQILIGSFLGDGCISRLKSNRYRLSIIHCEKQKDYCKWKSNMFGIKKLRYIKENGYSKKPAYRFNTKIIDIKYEIPKDKKTCPQWILDKIDIRGFVIWFLDDGYNGKNKGSLSTHSFNYESQIRIKKCLENKFNLQCKIYEDKRGKGCRTSSIGG